MKCRCIAGSTGKNKTKQKNIIVVGKEFDKNF